MLSAEAEVWERGFGVQKAAGMQQVGMEWRLAMQQVGLSGQLRQETKKVV